jgi:hypothetical protein
MKLRIVPYARSSMSAKALAASLGEALGYYVWRGQPLSGDYLNLNWGSGRSLPGANWINAPELKALATNKIQAFRLMEANGVSHVPFTTSQPEAAAWLHQGHTVLARTAGGQGGTGIHVIRPGQVLPTQPLYTKLIEKRKELRVHVMKGSVICVQEKRRRNGAPPTDGIVRSHDNDWVFCHNNIVEPTGLRSLGIASVAALGLDFGAVDVIWNAPDNRCYVLEVNTAPGLTTRTLTAYTEALVNYVNG